MISTEESGLFLSQPRDSFSTLSLEEILTDGTFHEVFVAMAAEQPTEPDVLDPPRDQERDRALPGALCTIC
uniref:Putative peptide pheromone n=1 Tax=Coprinellus disseminatus TaxID=71703 RepID=Q1WMU9_COPDI|nr:putative peptide pheromone [Coprinellus disseminatus]